MNVEKENVIITEKIITSEEETESNENNAIPSCSSASQSTSAYSQSPLPECTPRFLAKFELLLTDEKVSYCNRMFEKNEESGSAIYNAWKALKIASLPASEREALEKTLAVHTPKKIEPKKG